MSKRSILNKFYADTKSFLDEIHILDNPERIYNIDESWFSGKNQTKQNKVVVPKKVDIPYVLNNVSREHVTITMCICANGSIQPPMLTFSKSYPSDHDFHQLGPVNGCYTVTESGHIDVNSYITYVKHLEPMLCEDRPVVIFQDNLFAHESPELVEFCFAKQIHLYNFPSKSSHLLQPLDKMFGTLKAAIERKRKEALLVSPEGVSKGKLPILLRYAITAIGEHVVKNTFATTGLCPLDSTAIPDTQLVGDEPTVTVKPAPASPIPTVKQYADVHQPTFVMDVDTDGKHDDGGSDGGVVGNVEYVVERGPIDMHVQTDPVKSLPCSICKDNDASVHPAVTAGFVDLQLASVFLETAKKAVTKKRVVRRDFSLGKCLTTQSEVQRMRDEETEKRKIAEGKLKRKADIEESKRKKVTDEIERKERIAKEKQDKENKN